MKVIKFTLKGKTAFFKKPDVNTYLYFTYSNIHKVALLGILGAIYGYGGYNQQKKATKKEVGQVYPEFYEKLRDLKVGIAPHNYIFSKKVQSFNNSVGYASKEQGGNLIVKEQWLENPAWDIYLMIDTDEAENIADCLQKSCFKFIPYLGKNDHFADITDVHYFEEVTELNQIDSIHSMFKKEDFAIEASDPFSEDVLSYKYEEKLPIALEEHTNKYELESFVFTDGMVRKLKDCLVYQVGQKNIAFF